MLFRSSAIRKSLRAVNVDEAAERRNIYVSDRRWKIILGLVVAAGVVAGAISYKNANTTSPVLGQAQVRVPVPARALARVPVRAAERAPALQA